MGQLKKSIFPDIAGEEAGKITARLCSPAPTGEETEAGKQTEAEKRRPESQGGAPATPSGPFLGLGARQWRVHLMKTRVPPYMFLCDPESSGKKFTVHLTYSFRCKAGQVWYVLEMCYKF